MSSVKAIRGKDMRSCDSLPGAEPPPFPNCERWRTNICRPLRIRLFREDRTASKTSAAIGSNGIRGNGLQFLSPPWTPRFDVEMLNLASDWSKFLGESSFGAIPSDTSKNSPLTQKLHIIRGKQSYPQPRLLCRDRPEAIFYGSEYPAIHEMDFRSFSLTRRASAPGLPANENRPPISMSQFSRRDENCVRQVFRAVEGYCHELGKPPELEEIPSVLVLREPRLTSETAAFELKAMRALCRQMLASMATAREIGEDIKPSAFNSPPLNAPAWFAAASWQAIQDLSDRLGSATLEEMLSSWLVPAGESIPASEAGDSEYAAPLQFRKRHRVEEADRFPGSSLQAVPARKVS